MRKRHTGQDFWVAVRLLFRILTLPRTCELCSRWRRKGYYGQILEGDRMGKKGNGDVLGEDGVKSLGEAPTEDKMNC